MRKMTLGAALLALWWTSGCAGEPAIPTGVTATTDQVDAVTIAWSLDVEAEPLGFVVMRDGTRLAEVPAGTLRYVDTTTSPGTLESVEVLSATSGTDGVALSWAAAVAKAGTSHVYTVVANYDGEVSSAPSEPATGARVAPELFGYQLLRDGEPLETLPVDATGFLDPGSVQTFFPPTAFNATNQTRTDGVALTWTAATSVDGPLATYTLETLSSLEEVHVSQPATARRTALPITYELSRDDGAWIAIGNVTSYVDHDAPLGSIIATAVARPDPALTYIHLSLSAGPTVVPPPPSTYRLRVVNQTADAAVPTTTGARAALNNVTQQWERGLADASPVNHQPLVGAVHLIWRDLDPGEAAVSYRVVFRSDGAEGVTAPVVAIVNLFESLVAGGDTTCGLRIRDGKRVCWGANDLGQAPGDGSTEAFETIDVGATHGCGVTSGDGAVACWGSNTNSQATPPAGAFEHLAVGNLHACATRASDGAVRCWGDNTHGQAPASPDSTPYVHLTAGASHTCAIRASDGIVRCWGLNTSGQAPASSAVAFTALAAGAEHSCGIRKDNAYVDCWGAGTAGYMPPPLLTTRFRDLTSGSFHACGIQQQDGKVRCWGTNPNGEAPLGPSAAAFSDVAAGKAHTCGLRRDDGRLECWGRNNLGQAPQFPTTPYP